MVRQIDHHMLNAIKQFFEHNLSAAQPVDMDHRLKLATAALLIEMMQQDNNVLEQELTTVKESLKNAFDLTDDETKTLFELAQQEVNDATDYYQFTSLIARQYTQQQKTRVIEYLWMVAYADQHLDVYEEHMVRRIADLIYVSHKDMIKAKHRVQKQSGIKTG